MKLKSPDKLLFDIWESNIGLSLNILRTGSDVAKLSIDPSHRLTLENRPGCNVISVYLLVNLRMPDVPGSVRYPQFIRSVNIFVLDNLSFEGPFVLLSGKGIFIAAMVILCSPGSGSSYFRKEGSLL